MIKPLLFSMASVILLISQVNAQHQELNEDPKLWGKSKKELDSANLLYHFQMGKIHGHLRTFYSSTFNKNSQAEYAQAIGGGIQFISKPLYNLRIGVSGFFIYDAFSSDLTKLHPLSNSLNRYELGLFDITDPTNKTNLDRLEELYIQYQKNKVTITVGKQLLNTPFINLQDGRMRPTEVQGVWSQYRNKENKIFAGWLNRFSPRSTVEWYKTGESIGLFSVGVNLDGTKSGYKDAIESKGVALIGAELGLKKIYKIQFWNQYVENIFNSSLVQIDKLPTSSRPYYYGLQMIGQVVLNEGGNPDPNKTYFNPSQSSFVIGYYDLPDIMNFAMNKYSFPAYMQYNIDARYTFAGFWKGWEAQVIYFYKDAIENTYNNPKYYINKADMGHFNFILNFHF